MDLGLGLKSLFFFLSVGWSSLWELFLIFFGIVDDYNIRDNFDFKWASWKCYFWCDNNKMDPTFVNKEIVWAKVKGYPWWPAEVVPSIV